MTEQTTDSAETAKLRHEMRNLEAQIEMLCRLLSEGAERLEQIVADDCAPERREEAMKTARRLRRATETSRSIGD
ncbi:hypothetical protein [Croceicoccus sp. YJ47]|uniref:hypothetical protein n=1 Tax=Croceicoccus sp. YJ47 TaxID=2798724 RepID=UPI0019224A66|nr:hypothetical protein [Croceicoccus sp. YJ47]QQN75076.1 hypothetical protein JD971_05140 [Croceicoccus sp. YJ47]